MKKRLVQGKVLVIEAGQTINKQESEKIKKERLRFDLIRLDLPREPSQNSWNVIAHLVADQYNNYDSFVIIHYPEGMVYTGSALSFMLENLSKTVVLTDVNYHQAIKLAASYTIPEVVIVANNVIIRACRAKKYKHGYISPHYPILGTIKKEIDIDQKNVLAPPKKQFRLLPINPKEHIALVKLYPDISSQSLFGLIKEEKPKAFIIESYNQGFIPLDKELIKLLSFLSKNGIYILNVSQDMNTVENNDLTDIGIINIAGMTTESVMGKLSIILANVPQLSPLLLSKLMLINMRGEI